jgi:predicted dehydrogenase
MAPCARFWLNTIRLRAEPILNAPSQFLRIAIIGCGKIADQHVLAARRIPGCEVVALCDREPLMAAQLGERFRISGVFADAAEMLRTARPDVVHITTPPQGHFSLARQCLEAGCHVYLEKPFTVTAPEAAELIRLAEANRLKITAGHNLQFTLEMLEMRRLVGQDFLGGPPVHLESHFSYDLGDASYVGPLLGNRNHWVRQLPGQLLHNILSHGIAKLAEFLDDQIVEVIASAQQSAQLQRLGGQEILDELRVLIRDARGTTAFFCFSTQLKPGLNHLRICGPVNSILVDHASGSIIRQVKRSYKSYLTFFVPPLRTAHQHFRNACRNVSNFVGGRLHQDSGMKELVERFYLSIQNSTPPPIPYREILLTARLMDEVFAQIYGPKKAGCPEPTPPTGALLPKP